MAQLDKIEALCLRDILGDYIGRREKALKNKNLRPITRLFIQEEIDTALQIKNKIFGL